MGTTTDVVTSPSSGAAVPSVGGGRRYLCAPALAATALSLVVVDMSNHYYRYDHCKRLITAGLKQPDGDSISPPILN